MAKKSDEQSKTKDAQKSKTNKERPQGSGSVGSHKPGGDGRGNKKIHEDRDDRQPRR